MGKAVVTFCQAGGMSFERTRTTAKKLTGSVGIQLTTSAASAKLAVNAPVYDAANPTYGGFVTITAVTAIWVVAGPPAALVAVVPTTTAGAPGFGLLAGQTMDFAIDAGHTIAAIDWTP